MRIGLKVIAITVAAVFLTVAAASPGLAGGYGGHHGGGHHYGQKHHGGGHHYGHKRHGYGHRYGHKRHHYGLLLLPFAYLFGYAHGAYRGHHSYPRHRYGGHSYGGRHHGGHSHGHNYGHKSHGYKSAPRACHSVTKIAYDAYGRRAKFGGTMCYDAYGAAYILPGSRHIIHYYY